MGYLHQGHISLVRESKRQSGITVVSIFVNPTQFAPGEDLKTYPRNFQKDCELLENENVDLLFYPDENEIYNSGFQTFVNVTEITKILEGEFRPTHFRGVTTVVNILFNCVKPDLAFFGQKDAQQVAVIKQMVSDLKLGIEIIVCPVVREENGLALSSRNIYLSPDEKMKALILHKALLYGRKLIEGKETNPQTVIDNMRNYFNEEKSVKLEYVAIVNENGFRPVELIEWGNMYFLLAVAWIGKTRLIDNELVILQ